MINCKVCLSSGQLKCFLKLTISWKNHIDEYLPDTIVPKDKLKFVSGDIIYNDTNVKVLLIYINIYINIYIYKKFKKKNLIKLIIHFAFQIGNTNWSFNK